MHLRSARGPRDVRAGARADIASPVRSVRARADLLLRRALLRAGRCGGDRTRATRTRRDVPHLAGAARRDALAVRVVLPREARTPEFHHTLLLARQPGAAGAGCAAPNAWPILPAADSMPFHA